MTTTESPNAARTSLVPSVEPSSTTITSAAGEVCAKALLIAAGRKRAWLYEGMTTETDGSGVTATPQQAIRASDPGQRFVDDFGESAASSGKARGGRAGLAPR